MYSALKLKIKILELTKQVIWAILDGMFQLTQHKIILQLWWTIICGRTSGDPRVTCRLVQACFLGQIPGGAIVNALIKFEGHWSSTFWICIPAYISNLQNSTVADVKNLPWIWLLSKRFEQEPSFVFVCVCVNRGQNVSVLILVGQIKPKYVVWSQG